MPMAAMASTQVGQGVPLEVGMALLLYTYHMAANGPAESVGEVRGSVVSDE